MTLSGATLSLSCRSSDTTETPQVGAWPDRLLLQHARPYGLQCGAGRAQCLFGQVGDGQIGPGGVVEGP
ncbi:hypothetical protein NE236_39010 [Actinoallomurus purpureus]|uniref:hypothetical protein n=1 Tax=Actinoallomurus purpureus TaxID=478114 RepID=UPI0020939723|nr:hypothetical protein [Actinoallomurus purpureus]MCO6010965.1 hypothetical protein [Actinoallomurus purpureus]